MWYMVEEVEKAKPWCGKSYGEGVEVGEVRCSAHGVAEDGEAEHEETDAAADKAVGGGEAGGGRGRRAVNKLFLVPKQIVTLCLRGTTPQRTA